MVNWNICEDVYPGPDALPSFGELMSEYLVRGRQIDFQYIDEIEYFASLPAVSWSSAGADPIRDLRVAMARMGESTVIVGERMKEALDAFKDIPIRMDIPKDDLIDHNKKQPRTRAPRADFGFDRRGRKIR